MQQLIEVKKYNHFHFCCGLAGMATGFNRAEFQLDNRRGEYVCIGGIDVDPAACRDFKRATGVEATCLDLFDREQHTAFHGHEPPPGWRAATPADIRAAAHGEHPHVVAISAPCKGFSGLLSEDRSKGPKYQALNRLTLRCVWLMLEAWKDDPPEFIIFENVPRIATRGNHLLSMIDDLLFAYDFVTVNSTHDCGEIALPHPLAQSRKRFLKVARHLPKVPAFLYEPVKRPLRAVGDVLSKLPPPGHPAGGPMHRIPRLQWKTWVRLAFIEAGSDWRSLKRLAVENGFLKDYLIVPETLWQGRGRLGVAAWDESAGTVAGASRPENGKYSVADPQQEAFDRGYGIAQWSEPARTVQAQSLPSNGEFSVADPRFDGHEFFQFGVRKWDEPTGAITTQRSPGQGPFSVADPNPGRVHYGNFFRIVKWDEATGTVTATGDSPNNGGGSVADPRPPERDLYRKYHVTPYDASTGTVIGGHHSEEGAYSVADPNIPGEHHTNVYHISKWDDHSRTITGAGHCAGGALGVADPTPQWKRHSNNLSLIKWDEAAHTVIAGGKGVQGGWMSVADPTIPLTERGAEGSGPYGIVPWDESGPAVAGAARHDNGRFNVADPRLPAITDKLTCVIQSLDGTWHRPFTTLDLAALQNLVDPEGHLELDGLSDSAWRERIGNAVPPGAAQAIGTVILQTLLAVDSGQTFQLSAQPIWVQPIAVALSVDVRRP